MDFPLAKTGEIRRWWPPWKEGRENATRSALNEPADLMAKPSLATQGLGSSVSLLYQVCDSFWSVHSQHHQHRPHRSYCRSPPVCTSALCRYLRRTLDHCEHADRERLQQVRAPISLHISFHSTHQLSTSGASHTALCGLRAEVLRVSPCVYLTPPTSYVSRAG